jgi:hypothetical protein
MSSLPQRFSKSSAGTVITEARTPLAARAKRFNNATVLNLLNLLCQEINKQKYLTKYTTLMKMF